MQLGFLNMCRLYNSPSSKLVCLLSGIPGNSVIYSPECLEDACMSRRVNSCFFWIRKYVAEEI